MPDERPRAWRAGTFLGLRAFSTLGDQLLQFAVPLIVYRATGSMALAGLAFLVEWLPRLTSLPLAGLLADRFGGHRLYAVSDCLRAAACLLTAVALASWPEQAFALTAALMGLCAFLYAQAFIALESTVPQLVPRKDLAKAQSLLQVINDGSGVLGPALGGALLIWLEPVRLLWVSGAAFALSACGLLALRVLGSPAVPSPRPRRGTAGSTAGSIVRDLRTGVRGLAGQPVLLLLIGLAMVVNLMVGLALATAAALTIGHFGLGDAAFATLQTSVGALSVAAFVLMPWLLKRVSVYRIGAVSFAIIILGGALIAVAPSYAVYVLGYGLCVGLCGLFNVFIRVERLHWISPDERGRVISLVVLLNQLTLPLAGLLVALTAAWLPVHVLFLAVTALGGAAYALMVRPLRERAATAA
ncbi:MFS transporter [Nonomuraea sp. NPDC049480]|uniref:MFS transporter n=1 Tax=Nonomuraea sp. NPDC049480 TaxID=3364353 RepID=UPI00378B3D26